MSDDTDGPEDRRGAVAKLTEALAAAQAAARESLAELDESPDHTEGAVSVRERTGGEADTGDDPEPAREQPSAEEAELEDEDAARLRNRIAALPGVDERADQPASTAMPVSVPLAGERTHGSPGDDPADPVGGADEPGGAPGVVHSPSEAGHVPRPRRRLGLLYGFMALLLIAVPVLVYVGYRLASDSTAGEVLAGRNKPTAPGYTALVEPTPAALVMHVSDDGEAVGLTVLSLSGPDQKGGVILAAPVDVRLSKPRLGIESFAGIIDVNSPTTAGKVIGSELGLGFTDVVEVTDADLTRLVDPVAPLKIDNPEPVTMPDGDTLDAGTVELDADQVPGYLAATDAGNTLSGSLDREAMVWKAWVSAISRAGRASAIPGESDVGIGRYLKGLAAGSVETGSFPAVPSGEIDDVPVYKIDHDPAMLLIANAVPFPVAAVAGQRATVALLNGTGPGSAPPTVIQRLTFAGAQITTAGNATNFDNARTTLTWHDQAGRLFAMRMARQLGVGKLVRSQSTDSGVDVVVVMGRDLLDDPPAALTVDDVGGAR